MQDKNQEISAQNAAEKKKEEIIYMVESIQKQDVLEYLHTFIKLFLREWG